MWKHTRKNRHMRIKLKSQQLVLAFSWERKVWGCLTNICEMNALKHSILPSAWRGTWWADCTSKSPKRKRAEQLSCEEWGSFYQNQIASFWIAVPLSKWRSYAVCLWAKNVPLSCVIVSKNAPKFLIKPEAPCSKSLHKPLVSRDRGDKPRTRYSLKWHSLSLFLPTPTPPPTTLAGKQLHPWKMANLSFLCGRFPEIWDKNWPRLQQWKV